MKATRRIENDNILHCRFCNDRENYGVKLYETSPKRGIVCEHCLRHLKSYMKVEVQD